MLKPKNTHAHADPAKTQTNICTLSRPASQNTLEGRRD